MNPRVVQHRAVPDECTVPGELTGMTGHTSGGRTCRHNVAYICRMEGVGVISVVMESGVQNISYGITGSSVAKES